MVLAWSLYYALLSFDQKAVYTDLMRDEAHLSEIERQFREIFDAEYEKFKETEEYKEIDKWWETGNTVSYSERSRKLNEAEAVVLEKYKINMSECRQNWREASTDTYRARRKMERYRSAARRLIIIPEAKGVATDDETKQCTICTVNIKDNALPCGHVYCVECVGKMTCKCPNCKKEFVKNKVIKLYM